MPDIHKISYSSFTTPSLMDFHMQAKCEEREVKGERQAKVRERDEAKNGEKMPNPLLRVFVNKKI